MVIFRSQNIMKFSKVTAHILYIFSETNRETFIMRTLSHYIDIILENSEYHQWKLQPWS